MKEPNFKLVSKEQAFWEQEVRLSKMQIESIKKEMENGLKMIEIYENSIKFCEQKLKELK